MLYPQGTWAENTWGELLRVTITSYNGKRLNPAQVRHINPHDIRCIRTEKGETTITTNNKVSAGQYNGFEIYKTDSTLDDIETIINALPTQLSVLSSTDGLISGGITWLGTNYDYLVNAQYRLNGTLFNVSEQISLDAGGATDDRYDAVVGLSDGTIAIRKGTEEENPSIYVAEDNEVVLGQVFVKALIGGGASIVTKTKAEIDTMISGNTLVAGQWYEITGVHPTLYDDGTTSGTTIYLMAISTNKLATSGIGTFYNPKYNQAVSGFGIWDDKMYGTFSSIVGNFDYIGKETVTADNGATGLVLADGMIRWVSGDWSGATSITGGTSGATANVSGFTSPTYSVGAKVFWGGYAWSNVNGNVGSATNVLTLNAEWTKIAYNTTDYNIAYDEIEYDYANNMIIMRYDVVNNIKVIFSALAGVYFSGTLGIPYNGIAVQQWGNGFNGTVGGHSKIVTNGYDESVNFRGASQLNMTFEILGRNYNIEFGKDSKQENITFKNSSTNNNISLGAGAMQTSIGGS
jgi:hypothetical protein